ncbi:MAG: late competence development ComFB family protein [Ruminococcus sp.]|nr:late competence development ComFB family protein [Ruminococcus sp.]
MPRSKKDINKEAMFSKIMPSGVSQHNAPPNVKNVQPFDPYEDERDKKSAEVRAELKRQHMTEEELAAEEEEKKKQEEQSAPKKAEETPDVEEIINSYSKPDKSKKADPEKEQEKPADDDPDTPQEKKTADEPKPDAKEEQPPKLPEPQPDTTVKVINIHERMVGKRIEAALKKFGCCSCTLCRNDALAMALNTVSPKYIVTTEADVEQLLKGEDPGEVTQAISKAILHVKANPRH